MPIIVQKFGGSSVDGPDAIRGVADRIIRTKRAGNHVIAVVSAMGQTTDEMERLALQVNPDPPRREMDMLVTAGERITMALLAMAIHAKGGRAISFTGSQSGIITDTAHGNARIKDVRPIRLRESLEKDLIVIVAGFQGVSEEKEVTTLGRGGSDLTAVALASAFEAQRCELYKDVDGIMTADPRLCPNARVLDRVPVTVMIALAEAGSGVFHAEAARFAAERRVEVTVRSSFTESSGTRITFDPPGASSLYGLCMTRSSGDRAAIALVGGADRLGEIQTTPPDFAAESAPRRASDLSLVWEALTEHDAMVLLRRLHEALFEGAPR